MKLSDEIFGVVNIDEPVLVDLINSKPLQRLKGINQGGPCQYIHLGLSENNRFVHSVGAMLVLRYFKAPLREQIAGLLHDVSHTAFSHLADYVFGGDTSTCEYQDSILDQFILQSELPDILTRHGIAVEGVLDIHRFPLQEQPIPDLCADRIDYSLRHPFFEKYLAPLGPKDILDNIVVHEGVFAMKNPVVAWKYARAFLMWYGEMLAGPRCIAAHALLAGAIKRALQTGVMKKEDMFQDDEHVMRLLRASGDSQIKEYLTSLHPEFDCVIDAERPDLKSSVKHRYIDPKVVVGDTIKRVSELYPDFGLELAIAGSRLHKKEFSLRIVDIAKEVQNAGK